MEGKKREGGFGGSSPWSYKPPKKRKKGRGPSRKAEESMTVGKRPTQVSSVAGLSREDHANQKKIPVTNIKKSQGGPTESREKQRTEKSP